MSYRVNTSKGTKRMGRLRLWLYFLAHNGVFGRSFTEWLFDMEWQNEVKRIMY